MGKASGLTRGDKRRNERLSRLRSLVPVGNAIVGVDLGEDKQMLVLADHDSRVLVRKAVMAKAFRLGDALVWALEWAQRHGFASVTVACEPTGSRWLQVQQLADAQGLPLVCVQPLATHLAREAEDYTRDKSDYKDAVLIARLTAQLRCYVPEHADAEWALLRHLGCRRARLVTAASAALLQLRDLLSLAWPAVLEAAGKPFDSINWLASLAVVLDRCNGDPARVRRLGKARFVAAVRRELPRWGGQRINGRIIGAVFTACGRGEGAVAAQRRGALIRSGWALTELRDPRADRSGRDRDGRPTRPARPDRDRDKHRWAQRGGGRADPRRDRRTGTVHLRPVPGQTRRTQSRREHLRRVPRPHPPVPPRPPPGCGWRPGAPPGRCCATTRYWPPATNT